MLRPVLKLIEATVQQVLKLGVEGTTMDAISEAADLGRRTIYYHFSSKDECILAAATEVYLKHGAAADAAQSNEEDAAVAVVHHSYDVIAGLLAEPITRHLIHYPQLLVNSLRQSIGEFASEDIAKGIEQGRFTLNLELPLLNSVLVWALLGLLIEAIENEVDSKEIQRSYATLVLLNLGVDGNEIAELTKKTKRS